MVEDFTTLFNSISDLLKESGETEDDFFAANSSEILSKSDADSLEVKQKLLSLCKSKIIDFTKSLSLPLSGILQEIFCMEDSIISERLNSHSEELQQVRSELESSKEYIGQVLEAAEDLERSVKKLKEENEILRTTENSPAELIQLREENENYLKHIVKFSKQKAETVTPSRPLKLKESRSCKLLNTSKSLSLNQLKELIEDIYSVKEKYPDRTLEEFIVFYLNQKYGLRSLVNEWYTAIFNALDLFRDEPDPLLFSMILRKDIEESYRHSINDIKRSIYSYLHVCLRSKHPYSSELSIRDMVVSKCNGQLEDSEWSFIVNSMYDGQNYKFLINEIKDKLYSKGLLMNLKKKKAKPPKLAYNELLKIILNFHIYEHAKIMEPFIKHFRSLDFDADGVISAIEFQELCGVVGVLDLADELLASIDPEETDAIKLNNCIDLFAREAVEYKGQQVSVLVRLYAESVKE